MFMLDERESFSHAIRRLINIGEALELHVRAQVNFNFTLNIPFIGVFSVKCMLNYSLLAHGHSGYRRILSHHES
ncbi:unnamed protein product [Hymenolepis diminuta]|uniref:Uncharacterized protein n=1 Tax=Hymenolepis diminuta TaxID=6216 RepID=A0A564YGM4_HYMDI|nr:unnamed protein product [Hymenolepis diminuta]